LFKVRELRAQMIRHREQAIQVVDTDVG